MSIVLLLRWARLEREREAASELCHTLEMENQNNVDGDKKSPDPTREEFDAMKKAVHDLRNRVDILEKNTAELSSTKGLKDPCEENLSEMFRYIRGLLDEVKTLKESQQSETHKCQCKHSASDKAQMRRDEFNRIKW